MLGEFVSFHQHYISIRFPLGLRPPFQIRKREFKFSNQNSAEARSKVRVRESTNKLILVELLLS